MPASPPFRLWKEMDPVPEMFPANDEVLKSRNSKFNPLNAELNPICHLLALLGAHHILHISRIRVNMPLLETCIIK